MESKDLKKLNQLNKDKFKAESQGTSEEVAKICNNLGVMYSKYGGHEDAINEHNQERVLAQTYKNKIDEAIACGKLGEAYDAMGNFSKAIENQVLIKRSCKCQ